MTLANIDKGIAEYKESIARFLTRHFSASTAKCFTYKRRGWEI